MSRRGQLLFGAMSLIWGVPYLLIKVAVRELSAPQLVFARTAPAALLLVPLAWQRGYLGPLRRQWRAVLAYSAVEVAGPWFLLSSAEKRLSSSVSGLLIAMVPLIGAGLVLVVGHGVEGRGVEGRGVEGRAVEGRSVEGRAVEGPGLDRLDRRRLVGLLVGLAGVAALVGVDLRGTDLVAVGEVALTALGYAAGPMIISRRFADLPGLGLVAASMALTAAGYAPFALSRPPGHLSGEVIGAVTVLTLLCTTVAFLLFFSLIVEVGPARATVITFVNPAVAVSLGVVTLGEPLTLGIAIGFPLILAGSYLATRATRPAPALAAAPTGQLRPDRPSG